MIPHVLEVGPDDAPREAWIVHGILGSALNWRAFARRLAAGLPRWRLVLVDLRGHGDSPSGEPPHTVSACADDLVALAVARGRVPDALIGHSFGGKVVLEAAARLGAAVRQVWVLDAVPGPAALGDVGRDEDVLGLIDVLAALPQPLAARDDVRAPLRAAGFGDGIAGWTTTNLARTDAGFVWRFDLDVVRPLIADYARLDLWPRLVDLPAEVRLVRAGRSDRWTPDALARLAEAATHPGVRAAVIPAAGHWIHVDAPDELSTMLNDGLRSLDTEE